MGTLEISGHSKIKIEPEITVVTINIHGNAKNYKEAVRRNAEKLKEVSGIIQSYGFKRKDIQTYDFKVNQSWYNDDTKKEQQKTMMFIYSQKMKFKFPNDSKILSDIAYTIGDLKENPQINVRFITEHEKEYDEQLLAEATADAKSRADAICKAGGFKITGIDKVTINRHNDPFDDMFSDMSVDFFNLNRDEKKPIIDMVPEDVVIHRNIDIVWNVEPIA